MPSLPQLEDAIDLHIKQQLVPEYKLEFFTNRYYRIKINLNTEVVWLN